MTIVGIKTLKNGKTCLVYEHDLTDNQKIDIGIKNAMNNIKIILKQYTN